MDPASTFLRRAGHVGFRHVAREDFHGVEAVILAAQVECEIGGGFAERIECGALCLDVGGVGELRERRKLCGACAKLRREGSGWSCERFRDGAELGGLVGGERFAQRGHGRKKVESGLFLRLGEREPRRARRIRRTVDLRLAVEEQITGGHDAIILAQAAGDFPQLVAGHADLHFARLVHARAFFDIDDRPARRPQHGVARHGERGRGLGGDAALRVKLVQQLVAVLAGFVCERIVEHHAHLCAAGRGCEVWIDECDRRTHHAARQRGRGNFHFRAHSHPRQVALVHVEDEPHLREIADLEEHVALLHILTLIDIARDDSAGDGREDFQLRRHLAARGCGVEFRAGHAVAQEPLADAGHELIAIARRGLRGE